MKDRWRNNKSPTDPRWIYLRKELLAGWGALEANCHSLFLDTGALTAAFTLEVQLGAAYPADLIYIDGLNIGGEQGKGSFHTHTIGNLTHGEGGCMPFSLTLNDFAFEALDTLLVSFQDLIVHRDIVTGLELRKLSFSRQLLVHKSYSSVHNLNF